MTDDEIFDADRAEKTVKVRYGGQVIEVVVREMLPRDYARLAKEAVEHLSKPKEGESRDMEKINEIVEKVLVVSLFAPCQRDPLPPETYADWNKTVKTKLFNLAMDLNGMTKEAADEAKKDSAARTDSGTGSPQD